MFVGLIQKEAAPKLHSPFAHCRQMEEKQRRFGWPFQGQFYLGKGELGEISKHCDSGRIGIGNGVASLEILCSPKMIKGEGLTAAEDLIPYGLAVLFHNGPCDVKIEPSEDRRGLRSKERVGVGVLDHLSANGSAGVEISSLGQSRKGFMGGLNAQIR